MPVPPLMRLVASGLLACACASPSAATDPVRCPGPNGVVLLTNDPSRCVGPVERRLEAAPPSPIPPAAPRTPEAPSLYHGDPLALLLPLSALGPGWDEVPEAAEPVSSELRAAGVRATRTRHYTRSVGLEAQVCSLEIWAFLDAAAARSAVPHLLALGWDVSPHANVLVVLHGTTLELGRAFEAGLPAACETVKRRARMRVDAELR